MIGYPWPASVRAAAPAKWLKHAIQQVKANEGKYGRVTHQAKRDWHKLLLYNEHDCRGIRTVVTLAARELNLWSAYQNTHFVVLDAGREITIRAGRGNPALDQLLVRTGATRWAFLTAYNPEPVRLDRRENEERQQPLLRRLAAAGYRCLPGEGRDPGGKWPAEASVLVAGISRSQARAFGRQFGQLAIVAGHNGFPARLVASGLSPAIQTLSEVLSLRTIVLNLQFAAASGQPPTADAMKRLIDRADDEKHRRAFERLTAPPWRP
jgi:hypothetical protein